MRRWVLVVCRNFRKFTCVSKNANSAKRALGVAAGGCLQFTLNIWEKNTELQALRSCSWLEQALAPRRRGLKARSNGRERQARVRSTYLLRLCDALLQPKAASAWSVFFSKCIQKHLQTPTSKHPIHIFCRFFKNSGCEK